MAFLDLDGFNEGNRLQKALRAEHHLRNNLFGDFDIHFKPTSRKEVGEAFKGLL